MPPLLQAPRFLPFASSDAVTNMALDEAILEAHLQGLVPTTLRLYGFAPPAVSIGYGQHLDKETIQSIESKGFAVVRRPTGGRAVLHLGDLTYSFVCSSKGDAPKELSEVANGELWLSSGGTLAKSDLVHNLGGQASAIGKPASAVKIGLVSRSVSRAYQEICMGLISTLAQLGIDLELGTSDSNYRHSQDCFETMTAADLHYRGKKIIGSAQLRRKDAVLQHGSLILNQPQGLMSELFNSKQTKLVEGVSRHANLFQLLESEIAIEQMEEAFLKGFEQAFGFRFQISDLTAREIQLAKELGAKYEVTPS
jgi:lipoate-protein ligase A